MTSLIDQLLSYSCVYIGHEAEAPTLPINGVSHDLSLLHCAILLEMRQKLSIAHLIVEAANKHLVPHTLRQQALLIRITPTT